MITKGYQVYFGNLAASVAFVDSRSGILPYTIMNQIPSHFPDLTRRAPRSPRVRLGGYAHLPRLLDKCRADLAGRIGEYHYNCPRDRLFFAFAGVEADALKAAAATGRTDAEMLAWVEANASRPRAAWEVEAWSAWMDGFTPASDPDTAGFFAETLARISSARKDIHSWADLLDLDDYCAFGGRA